MKPAVIGFAAHSGTGKTTLLRRLIPALRAHGLRIGVIKHAHHTFDVDQPGKDSYELRHAGAQRVLIGSRVRWALMVEYEQGGNGDAQPTLAELLGHMPSSDLDLILVEGFKHEQFAKIELHRPSLARALLCLHDDSIIAVACDESLEPVPPVPVLDLNDIDSMRDFVLAYIANHSAAVSQPALAAAATRDEMTLMSGAANVPPPSGTLDLCYEGDPDLLPAAEATRRIQAHVPVIDDTQTVPLTEALARVLAHDVTSPLDVPGHTNSAVDGFALHGHALPSTGECTLQVIGRSFAGSPYPHSVATGQCVRIMTGAVMPAGTDTVVMLEHALGEGESESDTACAQTSVRIASGHRTGQNVRHAGEDLKAGQLMLRRGTRLMPAALGMLASVGIAEVAVTRTLRVAFFSTGDELRSLGETLSLGQVYDSNRYTLRGMLMRLGVEFIDMGVVRDDPDLLRSALDDACRQADVVITSGGVSTGDADYIKDLLQQRGQVGFWRVAVRPGRPLAFGVLCNDTNTRNTVFFGLPGNPVAVMVTFYQFVQPALLAMMGSQAPPPIPLLEARCPEALRKKPGRIEYYRAILSRDADGLLQVRPTGSTGSGLLHTMNDANCLIVLAEQQHDVPAHSVVPVQPFFAMV